MAEVVMFVVLIAVFIGVIGVIFWMSTELHKLRERLDEIETFLAEYKQTDSGKSQEYNHPLTAVTQFAGNNLVRSWWLGTQGIQGRKQEEE